MSTKTNILGISTASTSTSSTTRTRAHARAQVMSYAADMGLKPNEQMAAWVGRLIENDLIDERVLIEVIDETVLAPFPSWRYFAAIVRRLMGEVWQEKYTYEMWIERRRRWEARKGEGQW